MTAPAAAPARDAAVQREIAETIAVRCFGVSRSARVAVGPLAVNYFSFVFPVDVADGPVTRGVFVKIPKTDLRRRPDAGILPLSEADRALGREEYASLRHLETEWPVDDLRIRFVKPIGYLDAYNAIVTERVRAEDGCARLRRLDSVRLRGGRATDEAVRLLGRIGAALRRFHDRSRCPASFDGRALLPKLRRYCEALAASGASTRAAARTLEHALADYGAEGFSATTLKGLDVRNVLLEPGGDIVMIDPGRMKQTFREADLARFLLTWRILYWGTLLFACRVQPARPAEEAFLRGYFGDEPRDGKLLSVFLVKEILKHWHTAHDSLSLKGWPPTLRRATAHVYIDPFYKAQLAREVRTLQA